MTKKEKKLHKAIKLLEEYSYEVVKTDIPDALPEPTSMANIRDGDNCFLVRPASYVEYTWRTGVPAEEKYRLCFLHESDAYCASLNAKLKMVLTAISVNIQPDELSSQMGYYAIFKDPTGMWEIINHSYMFRPLNCVIPRRLSKETAWEIAGLLNTGDVCTMDANAIINELEELGQ
jgi:hypothetical protein